MTILKKLLIRPLEEFRGHHIGCAPGTHGVIATLVAKHVIPKGDVLDIGAHSGALLLRLHDLGFSEMMGTDLDPTRFDVPEAAFKRMELNDAFARHFSRRFQLVAATDVIEHLDSPRAFLKEVYELVEEGGWVVISLPNVASWEGRLKFFLSGELWQFGEVHYRVQRHISPITRQQMTMMMQEIGFRVVEVISAGSFSTWLRKALTFPLWASATWLRGISVLGASAIFLAQRNTPDQELRQPIHYRDRWNGIPDKIGFDSVRINRD
jgi:2-polyprenyl-3-methyl-5-hydroxy-6-metoxy-1,4-benzoquinol methylase